MKAKWMFLGTGASAGVPVIGCHCSVCFSSNEKNKRLRPSALLTIKDKKILIDAGPDLRQQALRFGIENIDGVIITHTHYDHIGGIDDLRAYYLLGKKPLPLILSRTSYIELQTRLPYLFRKKEINRSLSAQLTFHVLDEKRGNSDFMGIPFSFMTFEQGGMEVTGLRFGSLAYVSDIKNYPKTIFEDLNGVKTLIISTLRVSASPMHLSIEEACAFVAKVGAEKAFFMHMSHELDYEMGSQLLPRGIELAYDGLFFECEI